MLLKTILPLFLLYTGIAFSQFPSMTISHFGLSPNDTLWVMPGDSISFIFGGGGDHPMMSGHGTTESPVFFPTVTVTASDTIENFALTTEGVYYFHCGTNPANTANWGTIIVGGYEGTNELNATSLFIYPNPTSDVLNIISDEAGEYCITNINGSRVLQGTTCDQQTLLSISELPIGEYFVSFTTSKGTTITTLFKQ